MCGVRLVDYHLQQNGTPNEYEFQGRSGLLSPDGLSRNRKSLIAQDNVSRIIDVVRRKVFFLSVYGTSRLERHHAKSGLLHTPEVDAHCTEPTGIRCPMLVLFCAIAKPGVLANGLRSTRPVVDTS